MWGAHLPLPSRPSHPCRDRQEATLSRAGVGLGPGVQSQGHARNHQVSEEGQTPQGAAPGTGGGRRGRKVQTAPNAPPKPSEEAAARHAWHGVAGVSGRDPDCGRGETPLDRSQPGVGTAPPRQCWREQPRQQPGRGGVSDLPRLGHLRSTEGGWGRRGGGGRVGKGAGKGKQEGLD